MDDYQLELFEKFKYFRPEPKYPTYPPYHKGLYLEDYFIKWFFDNNIKSSRYFIPVSWTTCYVDNCHTGIQEILNTLDKTKSYFTVAQHDDAIREKLPDNTISFNAGGNGGGIPIPLICSPITNIPELERDIFCSFVGSITHPIRNLMCQNLYKNPKYSILAKNWTSSVAESELEKFISITSRSLFSLCPRGYGKSSFRLYEAIQLGSIPVIIYDEDWFPFSDELNWSDFSVRIKVDNLDKIDEILSSYDFTEIKQLQENLYKIWTDNFTMSSVCKKILSFVNKKN